MLCTKTSEQKNSAFLQKTAITFIKHGIFQYITLPKQKKCSKHLICHLQRGREKVE